MRISPDLNSRNKSAWEELYASTSEPIWGREPVGFLPPHLPAVDTLPPGGVLDAATGEGRNLPPLLALGRPVTACDAAAAALGKIPASLSAGIRTLACDLARVPLPDAQFAFILLSDVIETLPDPDPVLAELARLLVPGGMLLANIPGDDDGIAGIDMRPAGAGWLYQNKYYYRFYDQAEAEALLARAGLALVSDQVCEWHEPAHPHFRHAEHQHRSRVLLARRPAG